MKLLRMASHFNATLGCCRGGCGCYGCACGLGLPIDLCNGAICCQLSPRRPSLSARSRSNSGPLGKGWNSLERPWDRFKLCPENTKTLEHVSSKTASTNWEISISIFKSSFVLKGRHEEYPNWRQEHKSKPAVYLIWLGWLKISFQSLWPSGHRQALDRKRLTNIDSHRSWTDFCINKDFGLNWFESSDDTS